ncbi:HAD family hydrolase [Streptomyces sp. DT2A-34]|uniref:D-glycero-alpha-D-manno-heptose-1,7-bisphosphate 7-phosphatase n=1 Tax=Streptomyces sp. DT2A-34 TaxID=3051182 RepID=UPI00265BBFBA|nr:HAD family hydrolase [Streptomyces sp. DT2A-34]MDO0912061.1 HAD family hydrolase [Streptomyces sp. DT2A-34]
MTSVRMVRADRGSRTPRARKPAVFLDRDGTLTEPRHYPSRPSDLVLQPGIGPWLRALREHHGAALVVVTNQSGLARGMFTGLDLAAMHRHLRTELTAVDVELDAIYTCPHHVDGVVTGLARSCSCRKPEPGLLLRAAAELRLDLSRSWMIGDFATDVEAGNRAGCRTAWVGPRAAVTATTGELPVPTLRSATTAEALQAICRDLDV